MSDLKKELSVLDNLEAPDVWRDVEIRRPRSEPEPPGRHPSVGSIFVALSVAAAGLVLAIRAFYGGPADGDKSGTVIEHPILFSMIDDSSGDSNIYSINADGSGLRQVTSYPGTDHSPSWAPDYSRIAFVSDREEKGNNDIYVMDPDGFNVMRITDSPDVDGGPTWSPDGTQIAFWRSGADGTWEPILVDVDEGVEHPLPGGMQGDGGLDWSPNGIALTRNVAGEVGVYVLDPQTGEVLARIDGPGSQASPSWGPQGGNLVFVSGDTSLVVADPDTDLRRTVIARTSGSVNSPQWSPDGSQIVFQAFDHESSTREGALGELLLFDMNTRKETTVQVPKGQRLLWGLSW